MSMNQQTNNTAELKNAFGKVGWKVTTKHRQADTLINLLKL